MWIKSECTRENFGAYRMTSAAALHVESLTLRGDGAEDAPWIIHPGGFDTDWWVGFIKNGTELAV